jgi:selenocysteine lyase/cysteine desulfurase
LKKVGLDRIAKHTGSLAQELREGVARLGFELWTPKENPSPIVSFAHGRNTKEVKKRLEDEGIIVTFREHEGSVTRVGIALFNNREDIHRMLKVMERFA